MSTRMRNESAVGSVWAMLPEAWADVFWRIRKSEGPSEANSPEAKTPKLPIVKGTVAVVQVRGVIVQHASDLWYGDVTTDWIAQSVGDMAANPNIGAVVLDIDSPGGVVFGVEETADKIRSLRQSNGGRVPIYAVANSMAASAAFWLATAADKFYVTPGGQVGSVGVWQAHVDVSAWQEKMGIKTSLVSAGKYKVEGHPWAPLDDEARAAMQEEVDAYYEKFIAGVAANRGTKPADVRKGYGEGRLVMSGPAKEEGMVDGIATMEELLSGIIRPKQESGGRGRMAAAEIAMAEAGMPLELAPK